MITYCPMDDFTCPYYGSKEGSCKMWEMERCDPHEECDAFYGLEDDE